MKLFHPRDCLSRFILDTSILIFSASERERLLLVEGDISNLAGRMPLGETPDSPNPGPSDAISVRGPRWSPLWALVFVFCLGLPSWGGIAAAVLASDW